MKGVLLMALRSFISSQISRIKSISNAAVTSAKSPAAPSTGINTGAINAEIDKLKFNAQELRNTANFIRNEKAVLYSDIANLQSCITRMEENWSGVAASEYIAKVLTKINKVEDSLGYYEGLAKKFDDAANELEAKERNLMNQLNNF